jgi:hypothetical protein
MSLGETEKDPSAVNIRPGFPPSSQHDEKQKDFEIKSESTSNGRINDCVQALGTTVRESMPKYRIFVQDVGRKGYSALGNHDVFAGNAPEAVRIYREDERARSKTGKLIPNKMIAIDLNRQDLMPRGMNAKIPEEAFELCPPVGGE